MTSAFILRGRRGTCGTGLALVACLGARLVVAPGAAPLCGRRGRRDTWGTGLALVVRFALQAWHLVTCVALAALSHTTLYMTVNFVAHAQR